MARPAGLSMAEALRTVGLGLDADGARRAELFVIADGIAVEPFTAAGGRHHSWDDVLRESERQREQRQSGSGGASWVAPLALTRWSALLRIVGQLLDAQGLSSCTIDARLATPDAPRDCQVRVVVDDQVVIDGDDVQMHLLQLRTRQIGSQEPAGALEGAVPRRPWWAIWRRD